jgi:hypothetical protein
MICEENNGKMFIFSLIFQKIGKPEFLREAVFHKKLEERAENNFFSKFFFMIRLLRMY